MTPARFLLLLLVHLAGARGPHHPRGVEVAKHVHSRPTKKLTQDAAVLHDVAHLQEHLEEAAAPDLAQMSDDELEFYYFQVHDSDRNDRLDGLEIMKAILHVDHEEEGRFFFDDYVELVDQVLAEDDADDDGYLSYVEYAAGRTRAVVKERQQAGNEPEVKLMA